MADTQGFFRAIAPYAAKAASLARGLYAQTPAVQWAVETGYDATGSPPGSYNLAGISPGGIIEHYANLDAFVEAYVNTIKLPLYRTVLSAPTVQAQLEALGRSPWSQAHYAPPGGAPGQTLLQVYAENEPFLNSLLQQKSTAKGGTDMVTPNVLRWQWCAQAAVSRYGHLTVSQVLGQIHQESGGNPRAVSKTGAQGLMQIEPATGKELGLTDPWDPLANVLAGVRYMVGLIERFGTWNWALAGYYAGPGTVSMYKDKGISSLPGDVQSYVTDVSALEAEYRNWLAGKAMPSLTMGDHGEAVRLLQALMGMPPNAQDGVYGTETMDAVLAKKKAAGLPENHVVGDGLWSYLLYLRSGG